MQGKQASFKAAQAAPASETQDEMEAELRAYFDAYQAQEKQPKHQELLDSQGARRSPRAAPKPACSASVVGAPRGPPRRRPTPPLAPLRRGPRG